MQGQPPTNTFRNRTQIIMIIRPRASILLPKRERAFSFFFLYKRYFAKSIFFISFSVFSFTTAAVISTVLPA